ncbi:sulfurtransferase [Luteimonas viscosa]|uniref:Sulfurtransferase n=1 Tax=Luteimonas viscosa TaxID=1132694 RepID=A0A5D4XR41_9GAMM|nr:sulfurtransferase [Luteimonas viscosa]TYT25200.1 sulfurtransferase [Luteimonas viscosa]
MIRNIAAYRFVEIADPRGLAAELRVWAEAGALRGTVLVAPEGINLFLAGTDAAIAAFLGHLRADPRFADIAVKDSRSATVPFGRLKVKTKREIISFRRDGASPLRGDRAPAVAPRVLARWLAQGVDDAGRRVVLLDTRNREETAHGAFEGALTLPIDNFTDLPAALAPHRDALADATVVSYCTGGIRCEKAALWMRESGMDNVLQLDGGILGYFEAVGGAGYSGRCFVFDDRVALDPALRALVDHAGTDAPRELAA